MSTQAAPERVSPEVRRRNTIIGVALFAFALSVTLGTILLLASTRYNPFVERPQFLIKPER